MAPAKSPSPSSKTNWPSSTARSSASSASSGCPPEPSRVHLASRSLSTCCLRDPQSQSGADLITGDVEELKAAVHAALKKLETPPPPPPAPQDPGEPGSKLVYIICDERDRKATIPLRKFLKSQGIDSSVSRLRGRRRHGPPIESGHARRLRCGRRLLRRGRRCLEALGRRRNPQVAGLSLRQAAADAVHLSRRAIDRRQDRPRRPRGAPTHQLPARVHRRRHG